MEKQPLQQVKKILKRLNLNGETAPSDYQWKEFVSRVNSSFEDLQQAQYLLERSMEISSREMLNLNQKYENAQEIAHIGYWIYNRTTEKIFWSKETYRLFGINPRLAVPPYENIMQLIDEKDREKLNLLVERAFSEGKDFEMEFRIKNAEDGQLYWLYVITHLEAEKNLNKPTQILSGTVMDITERKQAENEMQKLHQQLLITARQAGMSEVATSVLHNVGNILNSVNVSISLIKEFLSQYNIKNLIQVSQMIEDHKSQSDYLLSDSKGKLIPEYLVSLAKKMDQDFQAISNEATNLDVHLQHIKDIVVLQKDLSGLHGIKDKIFLNDTIDLAIKMASSSFHAVDIEIIKNYQVNMELLLDKSRLLQILVNLIKNAKESYNSCQDKKLKKITISIKKPDKKPYVNISVEDNGVGIAEDKITTVFSLGYTTKRDGHGFGLHSSAISAVEVGGRLWAESEGINKGSTFILQLPLKTDKEKDDEKV